MNSITHLHVVPALSFSLDGHQLRVVIVNGDPWFVAVDVCEMLGLKNSRMALQSLDEDEKGVSSTYTLGGIQGVQIISESGFYTLILRCRDAIKPGSMPHRVRRWVTGEVIPSIRKTGSYSVQKQVPSDRQRRLCRTLVHDVLKCDDAFGRANFIALLKASMEDAGIQIQDIELLRPLPVVAAGQLDLLEGGAA